MVSRAGRGLLGPHPFATQSHKPFETNNLSPNREMPQSELAASCGKNNGKSEIQGSLHCAADDDAVRSSSRDDVPRLSYPAPLSCPQHRFRQPVILSSIDLLGIVLSDIRGGAILHENYLSLHPGAVFGVGGLRTQGFTNRRQAWAQVEGTLEIEDLECAC
jgi:hypothetical protein